MSPSKRLHEIGELQREVMEIVWSRGEASVHDVRAALKRDRPPAYTTVLSVLQKLEKNGWLRHRRKGRTYLYRARRSREQEGRSSLEEVVARVFASDPMAAFQHLLSDPSLDEGDLDALRRMIEERERELGDD